MNEETSTALVQILDIIRRQSDQFQTLQESLEALTEVVGELVQSVEGMTEQSQPLPEIGPILNLPMMEYVDDHPEMRSIRRDYGDIREMGSFNPVARIPGANREAIIGRPLTATQGIQPGNVDLVVGPTMSGIAGANSAERGLPHLNMGPPRVVSMGVAPGAAERVTDTMRERLYAETFVAPTFPAVPARELAWDEMGRLRSWNPAGEIALPGPPTNTVRFDPPNIEQTISAVKKLAEQRAERNPPPRKPHPLDL